MKGVIFTEFLGMVADRFSEDMVDDIIEASDLPSGGAYTAVGIYDHGEIVALAREEGMLFGFLRRSDDRWSDPFRRADHRIRRQVGRPRLPASPFPVPCSRFTHKQAAARTAPARHRPRA